MIFRKEGNYVLGHFVLIRNVTSGRYVRGVRTEGIFSFYHPASQPITPPARSSVLHSTQSSHARTSVYPPVCRPTLLHRQPVHLLARRAYSYNGRHIYIYFISPVLLFCINMLELILSVLIWIFFVAIRSYQLATQFLSLGKSARQILLIVIIPVTHGVCKCVCVCVCVYIHIVFVNVCCQVTTILKNSPICIRTFLVEWRKSRSSTPWPWPSFPRSRW